MPFRVENRRVVPYSFEFNYFLAKSRIKMSPHQVNKYLKLQSPLKSPKLVIQFSAKYRRGNFARIARRYLIFFPLHDDI